MSISRRGVLFGLPLLLAGCASSGIGQQRLNYAAKPDEKFPLPEMHLDKVKPELRRQEVAFDTAHPAGTVIVDTPARRLYYVLGDGRAMRYGVGVGRQGLALKGDAYIGRKSEWPSWTPTANMMRRDPRNLKYAGGMQGGPNNPLGARALYLYRGGNDTMFRLHGTNQPQSIGHAMSSGCIRMLNHDIIDLYSRVPVGSRVVVLQA
ncbi:MULTISPECIES: L,D-transpeptidase [unclassified Rhizobium]|uniref:L,D-transpeptidase n=1 Tax=unclassified Rhizobium TaxID=2613769 RepID=UPI000BC97888|nr:MULTISPECIES: L,D-transpeptidase [unclassified Rhizobium]MDH7804936.1 lipoprotein-anchoring transpeptidase ErfK/SrfK [Rhizobium sp. AN67]MDQ4406554.1 L,D-transpeptidase [Rhizobium sp. AN63]SOD56196.1 Lipoprotein-anchoring transpeptidase ErfK/SrfK [Rhizobium sp. AN6A]